MTVSPEEYIDVGFYERLCEPLEEVVHCPTEHLEEMFKECYERPEKKFVLVSSSSDYSVRLQAENHPNQDLHKQIMVTDHKWESNTFPADRYASYQVGPACDTRSCRPSDKYVVKVDRHSIFTFNEIPANIVRWFCTNLDIEHPRATWIPFGVNDERSGEYPLHKYVGRKKTGLLFIALQDNTWERIQLKKVFSAQPWVTYYGGANLPFEEYLAQVSSHYFVMSPFGNGLDTYRNYEAMYLNSFPIVNDSVMTSTMIKNGLPVVACNSLASVSREGLMALLQQRQMFDLTKVTKSYWEKAITAAAAEARNAG